MSAARHRALAWQEDERGAIDRAGTAVLTVHCRGDPDVHQLRELNNVDCVAFQDRVQHGCDFSLDLGPGVAVAAPPGCSLPESRMLPIALSRGLVQSMLPTNALGAQLRAYHPRRRSMQWPIK